MTKSTKTSKAAPNNPLCLDGLCMFPPNSASHARPQGPKEPPGSPESIFRGESPQSPFCGFPFFLFCFRRCIFAEMATGRPLLTGTSESDQLARIFRQMGTPTPLMYPGLQELPDYRVSDPDTRGSGS